MLHDIYKSTGKKRVLVEVFAEIDGLGMSLVERLAQLGAGHTAVDHAVEPQDPVEVELPVIADVRHACD